MRSRVSSKVCCACASTCGPGPLRSVTRPSSSASLILLRVSPGTRIKASTKPRRLNRASNACALSSPKKPLTVSVWPRSASTCATFRPLPAAWVSISGLRLTSPGASCPRRTVKSSAGLRVTVRIRAIRAPPPTHELHPGCPRSTLRRPGFSDDPCSTRVPAP